MQACPAESATHVRHTRRTIESCQYTHPVHQQDRTAASRRTESLRGQAGRANAVLQSGQVLRGWLVGYQDEPGLGMVTMQLRQGIDQDGFIGGPGRAGHESWGALPEAEEWIVRGHGPHPVEDTVEPGVPQDPDSVPRKPQSFQSGCVSRGDGACCGDRSVSRLQQRPGGPAKAATPGPDGRSNQRYFNTAGSSSGGQLGPDIQLGKDQQIGLERLDQPINGRWEVIGEIVGRIGCDLRRQSLG